MEAGQAQRTEGGLGERKTELLKLDSEPEKVGGSRASGSEARRPRLGPRAPHLE